MKTNLEQIKDQVAKEHGHNNWRCAGIAEIIEDDSFMNILWEEVTKRYAAACCEASLAKAAENAVAFNSVPRAYSDALVNKDSITNKQNIVLL